jgi:hypothetical protein
VPSELLWFNAFREIGVIRGCPVLDSVSFARLNPIREIRARHGVARPRRRRAIRGRPLSKPRPSRNKAGRGQSCDGGD